MNNFFDPNGDFNLILTVLIFIWASYQVWRGALLGARSHAKPRLFVAVALSAGVVVNTAALFGWLDPHHHAAIARAVTWMLVVSLGFTAITGVRYGRKVERAVETFDSLAEDDEV